MDKLLDQAYVLIAGILLYIGDKLWKRYQAAREKALKANNTSVEYVEEIERQVRHIGKRFQYEFHAMRVYVMHWSNGTVTEAGVHLVKITFRSEVVIEHSVELIHKYFQETLMPDMLVTPFIHVIRSGIYHLKSIDDLDLADPQHKEYRDWLESYKVRSTLWVALKNTSGKMMAILVLHFPANSRLADTDISKIKDMKRDIEDVYNKIKKIKL